MGATIRFSTTFQEPKLRTRILTESLNCSLLLMTSVTMILGSMRGWPRKLRLVSETWCHRLTRQKKSRSWFLRTFKIYRETPNHFMKKSRRTVKIKSQCCRIKSMVTTRGRSLGVSFSKRTSSTRDYLSILMKSPYPCRWK